MNTTYIKDGIIIGVALNRLLAELRGDLELANKVGSEDVTFWEGYISQIETIIAERKFDRL